MMETQTGRKIKKLRSDNGGEYKSDPFLQVCQEEGIVRHFTVAGTPQQNGVSERMNRTLVEKVRCMLSNAGLTKGFWGEAIKYASHLVNHLPSATIGGKTPMEKWFGKPITDYDSLHVWGCSAYYHVMESKLDPRAKKAIFLGFTSGVKGYRLWCLESKKVVLSRDVTFNESAMLQQVPSKENVEPSAQQQVEHSEQVEVETPFVPSRTVQIVDCPEDQPLIRTLFPKRMLQFKKYHSSQSPLQPADQSGISENQLDMLIQCLMHFQLLTMTFLTLTERQCRVQIVTSGNMRWMRR